MPRAPAVRVDPSAIERRGSGWRVVWMVGNDGPSALTVREAWHPHARFRSSRLRRSLRVPPRGAAAMEMPARIDAGPNDEIENCFLILRVAIGHDRWRVIARLRVRVDDGGIPRPRVERVDVHPGV